MKEAASQRATLTARGAWIAGLGVAFLGVGLARGDGLLAALGLAGLILLGGARWVGRWHVGGWSLRCDAAASCHAGQRLQVRWGVRNGKRFLDGFSMHVQVRLAGDIQDEWRLSWVAAGDEACCDSVLSPEKRGYGKTHEVRWSSLFPLGLWQHERTGMFSHDLSIFPRLRVPRSLVLTGVIRDAAAALGSNYGMQDGELRGLRPWRAGDSPKRIHAAASARSQARGAGPMVCECDPPGHLPKRVMVVFHSFGSDGTLIRPEVFEQYLGHACGVLRLLTSQAIPVTFVADFDHWLERRCDHRAQLAEIFHLMTRVKRHGGTELHELQRLVATAGSGVSWVIVSDMPKERWQGAFHSLGDRCLMVAPKKSKQS